jgi:deoxyribose-phosphate aldolase
MKELIGQIDYTLLDQFALPEEIIEVSKRAIILGVKSVCVLPQHVKLAFDELVNTPVLVCSVVSFPDGEATIEAKKAEIVQLIHSGADEIDIVWNYKKINERSYLEMELTELSTFCKSLKTKRGKSVVVKVIVESGLLSIEETIFATLTCMATGVDFIKTSTGKVEVGAELCKIEKMNELIQENTSSLQIKASGGIRNLQQIQSFKPFIHRYGIGYKTVDKLFEGKSTSYKSQEY